MRDSLQLESAVAKLALMAEEIGLSIDDLTHLLESGVTVREVIEIVALRLLTPVQ